MSSCILDIIGQLTRDSEWSDDESVDEYRKLLKPKRKNKRRPSLQVVEIKDDDIELASPVKKKV